MTAAVDCANGTLYWYLDNTWMPRPDDGFGRDLILRKRTQIGPAGRRGLCAIAQEQPSLNDRPTAR
jgi:hypothetical protein